MQISLLPLWPGFILIGFFFGYTPMFALWAATSLVALLHYKQANLVVSAVVLTAVGFASAMLTMILS